MKEPMDMKMFFIISDIIFFCYEGTILLLLISITPLCNFIFDTFTRVTSLYRKDIDGRRKKIDSSSRLTMQGAIITELLREKICEIRSLIL